jgi:hypothetical protein
MAKKAERKSKAAQTGRRIALGYPEVEEGVSCSKASFKARGKAFLFLGAEEGSYTAMMKLGESLAEAGKLAAQQPSCYKVGARGWVTLVFRADESPPLGLMERWIDESFRVLAPKQLVAMLPARGPRVAIAAKTVKAATRGHAGQHRVFG